MAEQLSSPVVKAPEPATAAESLPTASRVALSKKFARKSVALSADMSDSLAGGGAAAGASMAQEQRSASDVAAQGFSGSAQEVPHRKEMEQSFGGADFSGVKAYTDGPALKANNDLGAHAYAAGDQVAFASSNPSKETVAHELTHVLQHTGEGPARKSTGDGSDGGIDTSGEGEAERVEAAVASGKPASSVLGGGGGGGGPALKAVGPARKRGPALEAADPKFAMGLTFSPEGMEKSYQYKIWDGGVEIPIAAVPGLNAKFDSNVIVRAAGGVNWKEKALTAALGVEGLVGIGLSYGRKEIAEVYGMMEAKADGGFEYKKGEKEWELSGNIGLSANLAVGVSIANGILDQRFEFGKCEIGKLTGLYWKDGHFDKGKLGWEWGKQAKELFAAVKKVVEKALHLAHMAADAAKAAYDNAKKLAKGAYHTAGEVIDFVTGW